MMIGELDFGGVIYRIYDHDNFFLSLDIFFSEEVETSYQEFSAVLFVCFLVIMTIIIMNLLTGLALDDIQKIAENAEFKKLAMQVELVLGLERLYQSLLFWIPKSSYKQNSKTHITSVEASSVAFLKRSYYLSWEYIIPSIIDGADDSSGMIDLMIDTDDIHACQIQTPLIN